MKSEVEDKYTPAVAEALLVACHDNPAWNKKHLQADCPEAHLYHILETEITEEIEEHSAEQELKLMMELDGTVPKELSASLPGLNGFDVGGGSGSGPSPHKAIEDTKENETEKKQTEEAENNKQTLAAAKLKAERAERAEEKEKLPETHAMRYLKNLPTDISGAHESLIKARKSSISGNLRGEYESSFKQHLKSLNEHRKKIEQGVANGRLNWDMMKSAKAAVTSFQRDKEILEKNSGHLCEVGEITQEEAEAGEVTEGSGSFR